MELPAPKPLWIARDGTRRSMSMLEELFPDAQVLVVPDSIAIASPDAPEILTSQPLPQLVCLGRPKTGLLWDAPIEEYWNFVRGLINAGVRVVHESDLPAINSHYLSKYPEAGSDRNRGRRIDLFPEPSTPHLASQALPVMNFAWPVGARSVICSFDLLGGVESTRTPGLTVEWSDGKQLRINSGPDGYWHIHCGDHQYAAGKCHTNSQRSVSLAVHLMHRMIELGADVDVTWTQAIFLREDFPQEPSAFTVHFDVRVAESSIATQSYLLQGVRLNRVWAYLKSD